MELSEYLNRDYLIHKRMSDYINSLDEAKCISCNKPLKAKDWAIFDREPDHRQGLRIAKQVDSNYYYCDVCRGYNSHIMAIKGDSGLSDSEVFELLGMEEQVNEPIYIDGGGED